MKKYLIIKVLCIFLLGCCKDSCTDDSNPDCPNYNPCKNIPQRPASFTMYEQLGLYLPDSLMYLNKNIIEDGDIGEKEQGGINFDADYLNADSYEWQVGHEATRRQGASIFVGFGGNKEDSVKITLFVTYTKNKDCFKGYNGRDTLTKTIYFVDYLKHVAWGTYIGTWEHNPIQLDTFYYRTEEDPRYSIKFSSLTGLWGLVDSIPIPIERTNYVIGAATIFNGLKLFSQINWYIDGKYDYQMARGRLHINPKTKSVKFYCFIHDLAYPNFKDAKTKLLIFNGKKTN